MAGFVSSLRSALSDWGREGCIHLTSPDLQNPVDLEKEIESCKYRVKVFEQRLAALYRKGSRTKNRARDIQLTRQDLEKELESSKGHLKVFEQRLEALSRRGRKA